MSRINKSVYQLYAFNVIGTIAGFFYGFYYPIFLLKSSSLDISSIIIENIVGGISAWMGIIIGNLVVGRLGHIKVARLAFAMFALTAILTFNFTESIGKYYLIFGLIRGLATGLMGSVAQIFIMQKMKAKQLNQYYYIEKCIGLGLAVVLPMIVGLLVNSTYKQSFLISAIIYTVGIFIPFKTNKKISSRVDFTEIKDVRKNDMVFEFGLSRIVGNAANTLNGFLFAIIPFLIMKSEFGVGTLTSITSLAAAIVAFYCRNRSFEKQVKWGYISSVGRLLSNVALVFSWATPVLVVRSLLVSVLSIFTEPVSQRIETDNQKQILNNNIFSSVQNLNIFESTLNLAGMFVGLISLLVLTTVFKDSQTLIIQSSVILFGFWKIFHFYWIQSINKKLKGEKNMEESIVKELKGKIGKPAFLMNIIGNK